MLGLRITGMVTPRIGRKKAAHLYIKEWLDHLDLSDEKVANRLGVARETVYRWRTGDRRLNPEKIAALAAALNLEPLDLYRRPSEESLDALVKDAPPELRATAADIVRRLVGKAS